MGSSVIKEKREPLVYGDYVVVTNNDADAQTATFTYVYAEPFYLHDLVMQMGSVASNLTMEADVLTPGGVAFRKLLEISASSNQFARLGQTVFDQKTSNVDGEIGVPSIPYLIPAGYKLRCRVINLDSGALFRIWLHGEVLSEVTTGVVSGTNISASHLEGGVIV